MKKRYLAGLATGLFLVGMAGGASATLIGNAHTVSDTDTNLEWYMLTETTGFSYNQMLNNFANVSSQFYGYSYATTSDLHTLWGNAGYTGDFYNPVSDPANVNAITDLYDLFGQTGTDPVNRADGLYDDEDGGNVGLAFLLPDYLGDSYARILPNHSSPDDVNWPAASDNDMGSWIYRSTEPVPEPATMLLFGTGLTGLIGSRLRKKKK